MSYIYLKVTFEEKNWRFQVFNFQSVLGAPTHKDIFEF